MNKRLLKAAFVVVAGLALSARPSGAQTATYDLDLTGTLGEPGMFHVKLQKWDGTALSAGKVFRITQIKAHSFPNNAIDHGNEVFISFYGQLAGVGPTVSLAGISGDAGVTTITSSIPANPQTHNWILATYNGVGTKYASFTSPTGVTPDVIRKNAQNQFLESAAGRITTNSLASSAKISVVTPGGSIYSGTINIGTAAVPEASSMALLLPGLVPLGMMMRRRTRSRASVS